MTPYLYFLMEIGTREFMARCLTACIAAERGFKVLLGYQYTLLEHAPLLPPGIYFSKGTNAVAVDNMKMAKEHGHITIACEEENFFRVLENSPIVCSDDSLPESCDLFLAMGQEEEKYIRGRFGVSLNVANCGNARTDILRTEFRPLFQEKVQNMRNRFGKYILVNSNLGIINSAMKHNAPKEIFYNWTSSGIFDPALSARQRGEVFQDFIEFEEGNALALRAVLKELAKRDFTVLVRPHPGEKKSTWLSIVDELESPNISVMTEGDHIPSILASELLVHTACTTGVEALLLGAPSLGIRPTNAKAHDYYLSNKFNVTCTSSDEAMAIIDHHMAGDTSIDAARAGLLNGLTTYLDAIDDGPLAADRIIDAFERVSKGSLGGLHSKHQERRFQLNISRESEHYTENPYMRQKLGITAELVFSTIESYKKILGRFSNIICEQLSDSVFKISQ